MMCPLARTAFKYDLIEKDGIPRGAEKSSLFLEPQRSKAKGASTLRNATLKKSSQKLATWKLGFSSLQTACLRRRTAFR